jgi:hypothetical protein
VRTRLERASPRRLRIALAVASVLVFVGLITHGNYAGSGDPVHYMVIARSVAFDRDFDLRNDYSDAASLITEPVGRHAVPGRNGVLRPVHDVGMPLLAAPYFAVAYELAARTDRLPESFRRRAKLNAFIALRQLMSLLMIAVTAVLAVAFFNASWRLTGEKAGSFLWALVWTLSPPLLSHGYVFFTEVPSALIALMVYSRLDDLRGDHARRRGLLLGLLTGLLLLVHVRNVGLVIALAALVGWRVRHDVNRGTGFAAGLAAMAAVKIALNAQFWGTFITTPHEHFGPWPGIVAFASSTTATVLGMLLDARHGLLLSAPIYLLVPAGWLLLARRSRPVAIELLVLVGAYLLFVVNPVTNIHGWRGGWSPAARFLVPVAPFLAIGVPLLLRTRAARIAAVVVLAQVAIDAFMWGHPMALWSDGSGTSPYLQGFLGQTVAAAMPIWEPITGTVLLGALAALGVWAGITRLLVRRGTDDGGREERRDATERAHDA